MLRLSPEAFWRMTPRELAFVLRALGGGATGATTRAALDALCARFPDHH